MFPFAHLKVTIDMLVEADDTVDFACNVSAYDETGQRIQADNDGHFADVTTEHLAFALCQVLAELYDTDIETIYGWIGHGLTVEATETAEA